MNIKKIKVGNVYLLEGTHEHFIIIKAIKGNRVRCEYLGTDRDDKNETYGSHIETKVGIHVFYKTSSIAEYLMTYKFLREED